MLANVSARHLRQVSTLHPFDQHTFLYAYLMEFTLSTCLLRLTLPPTHFYIISVLECWYCSCLSTVVEVVVGITLLLCLVNSRLNPPVEAGGLAPSPMNTLLICPIDLSYFLSTLQKADIHTPSLSSTHFFCVLL